MFSKTNAKHLALGLTLALALATAPQALAGPAFGGDLGATVTGFFADLWHTVAGFVGGDEGSGSSGPMIIPSGDRNGLDDEGPVDEYGPYIIPNGSSSEAGEELGPMQIPSGAASEAVEFGPWALPDGSSREADEEFGPWQVPNG